jgi:hypothetical protein
VRPVFRAQVPHASGAEVLLDATLQEGVNRRGVTTIGAALTIDLVRTPGAPAGELGADESGADESSAE